MRHQWQYKSKLTSNGVDVMIMRRLFLFMMAFALPSTLPAFAQNKVFLTCSGSLRIFDRSEILQHFRGQGATIDFAQRVFAAPFGSYEILYFDEKTIRFRGLDHDIDHSVLYVDGRIDRLSGNIGAVWTTQLHYQNLIEGKNFEARRTASLSCARIDPKF